MSANQPTKVSLPSLAAFALVVAAAAYIIYAAFGGEYGRATLMARFDFHKPPPPGAATAVDLHPLLQSTPKLLQEGQQVYEANCVPCHGPEGYGNGPRAAGLNPPPRNYHTGVFKYGTSVLTMYHTVTNGSPGSSMPSFVALSPEERMAVVHYVRQWIPAAARQPNSAADLAALATPVSTGPTPLPPLNPVPDGPRIPIDIAMQIVADQAAEPPPAATAAAKPGAPGDAAAGAAIYQTRCQSCHGADGQGGVPTMMVESAPYLEVTPASFQRPQMLASIADAAGFDKIVLHGLPGRMMPGAGLLTRSQLDNLYAYVQQLASATHSTNAPGGSR